MKRSIKSTPLDRLFMTECGTLISNSTESIYLVAGELGSLMFQEIQDSLYQLARTRQVKKFAYATDRTPVRLRNYALSMGFELYIGKKSLDKHYLVLDRRHYVISKDKDPNGPTTPGTRTADVVTDDPEGAEGIIRTFNELTSGLEPVTTIDDNEDSFLQMLHRK